MSAGRVRVGTHDMHDVHFLSCLQDCLPLLICGALMFIGRHCLVTEHPISLQSLNIFHASQTVCKRLAANALIFMGKRAFLILFHTGFVKRSSVSFARKKNHRDSTRYHERHCDVSLVTPDVPFPSPTSSETVTTDVGFMGSVMDLAS